MERYWRETAHRYMLGLERELAKQQVALYKELRQFVQFGTFYRLLSPFEGSEAAWMFVSKDELHELYHENEMNKAPSAA